MALLASDKELAKRLELTELHDLSKKEKVEYLDAQISSMKALIWRNRVDAMVNKNVKTDGKEQQKVVRDKIEEFEDTVSRYAEAVTILEQIKSEL